MADVGMVPRMREYAEATRKVEASGTAVVVPSAEIERWARVYEHTARETGEFVARIERQHREFEEKLVGSLRVLDGKLGEVREAGEAAGMARAVEVIERLQRLADAPDLPALRMAALGRRRGREAMSKFFDDVLRAREQMRKSEARSLGQLVSQGLIAPRVAKLLHEMEDTR